MKRAAFDPEERPGARPAPEVRVALACGAAGCPWVGSSGANGHFYCLAHYGQEVREHPAITARTVELRWFAQFIADVQRMHTFPRKGEEPWVAYASTFWAESDPSMQPTDVERRNPRLYVYRMFGELRAMALGKPRPAVHVAQRFWKDWARPSRVVDDVQVPA